MHNPAYESTPWLGRTCHRKSLLRKKVTLKVREASDPTQCTTGFEVDVLNVICRKAPSIQDVVLTPTGPRMLSIVTKHPKSRPSTTSCRNMIQFQDKQPTIVASATTRCSWWRCKWQLESRANQPLKPPSPLHAPRSSFWIQCAQLVALHFPQVLWCCPHQCKSCPWCAKCFPDDPTSRISTQSAKPQSCWRSVSCPTIPLCQ